MKILLLEDDEFIAQQIKNYFELNDHKVDFFENGIMLLENAVLENYDIFLLDINTPKKNGFETLREIRKEGFNTPAIYITAQNDIEYVKEGYESGCCDYIRKPFILDELELRINHILHQKRHDSTINLTKNHTFNLSTMQLFYNNERVELKPQEKNLLYILVKNIGYTISPETIKNYIWEDKDVCDNTLRTHIKKTREKLGENFILNIRNLGYKIEKYD